MVAGVAQVPQGPGVCRRHELEVAGKGVDAVDADDPHLAVLHGLPQGLQHVVGKLGELVQEEHALVRKGNLAGKHRTAAPDEAAGGDGVVGSPEGPHSPGYGLDGLSGHGVDEKRLGPLLLGKGRQDSRHPAGKHGFAGPGRADHEACHDAQRRL